MRNPYQTNTTSQEGFSLVELAIALVVIGLMLGGIFKGKDLIDQGRLQKCLTQITDYHVALINFIERYDALPGDFASASTTFGKSAQDGNQNGVVEGYGLEAKSEAVGFWQHLFLAGLIPDPGRPQGSHVHFGQGAPKTPLGGGVTVETDPAPDLKGLWMILGHKNGNRGNGPLLTPAQAQAIDRKLDNGHPTSGHIRTREGHGVQPGKCVANGKYALDQKEPACVLYISVQH